jgi:hypothetical protein
MFSVKEGDSGGLITFFSLLKGKKLGSWDHYAVSVVQLSELYNFKGYVL